MGPRRFLLSNPIKPVHALALRGTARGAFGDNGNPSNRARQAPGDQQSRGAVRSGVRSGTGDPRGVPNPPYPSPPPPWPPSPAVRPHPPSPPRSAQARQDSRRVRLVAFRPLTPAFRPSFFSQFRTTKWVSLGSRAMLGVCLLPSSKPAFRPFSSWEI